MPKHVVVIASGETERRSLPHLLSHLQDDGVFVEEVRIPPRNRKLTVRVVESLIKGAWYENSEQPSDKFVVLVDTDGRTPEDSLDLLKRELPRRLGSEIGTRVQYAYAQWHLEAWYFADETNLRECLGKALGNVDASSPDEIQNPKLHLKNLLGEQTYTARVSEDIAKELDAGTIAHRSPSFSGFLEAIRNGELCIDSGGA